MTVQMCISVCVCERERDTERESVCGVCQCACVSVCQRARVSAPACAVTSDAQHLSPPLRSLYQNKIAVIPQGAFDGLAKLKYLSVPCNVQLD